MPLLVMIGSLFVVMAGARLTGATELIYQVDQMLARPECCNATRTARCHELRWHELGRLTSTGRAAFVLCASHQGASFAFGPHCDLDGDSLFDTLASALLVLVLSNLCSNVPTVMLLAAKISADDAASDDASGDGDDDRRQKKLVARVAWLVLAWTSTVRPIELLLRPLLDRAALF